MAAGRVHPEIMRVWPFIRAELLEATGYPSRIVSGWRSATEQRRLYLAYLRGRGGRAAPPGASAHNFGLGIDVLIVPPGIADPWAWATSSGFLGFGGGRAAYRELHKIAGQYGLESIVAVAPDDPFHLQVRNWAALVTRRARQSSIR